MYDAIWFIYHPIASIESSHFIYGVETVGSRILKGQVMEYLPSVEIEPNKSANASVIWLHGLGANGHDFAPIVPMLSMPEGINVRYVFPHAPEVSVTINNGYIMPAWYDILEMSIERKIDTAGLMTSVSQVQELIQREIDRGIDSKRIVIAGFSQGGAVAYQSALTFSMPLAGLLVMSSYFATNDSISLANENKDIPVHVYHGTLDPVVPEELGQKAMSYLTQMGLEAEYHTYRVEHTVAPDQISDIATHLKVLLQE